MTIVLLARHGESDWNRARRWQGHADRPLTDLGREQAAALAAQVEGYAIAAVYSSDLQRAHDTARAVAERHGIPHEVLPDLREVDVGSWSGLGRDEVEARFPDGAARWHAGETGWDDGETYEAMAERVVATVERIAAAHVDQTVLVVAHGGPLRAVHARAIGLELGDHRRTVPVEPNARLSAVEVEGGRFRLVELT
ncbi:MAG: histidine phosphatase family protein [Thermoleophilia bacterium]